MSNQKTEIIDPDVITEQDFINFGWKKVYPAEEAFGWAEDEYFYEYAERSSPVYEVASCTNYEARKKGWDFGFDASPSYTSRRLLISMMNLIKEFQEYEKQKLG